MFFICNDALSDNNEHDEIMLPSFRFKTLAGITMQRISFLFNVQNESRADWFRQKEPDLGDTKNWSSTEVPG